MDLTTYSQIMCLLTCAVFACLTSVNSMAIPLDGDNEIIKPEIDPVVPPEMLEAFYYLTYSDLPIGFKHERFGEPSTSASCENVRQVPESLRHPRHMKPSGLDKYYQKYTEAYNIPVVGQSNVPDRALTRACYVLRFLLADRQDVRRQYYKAFGRVAVIGSGDHITAMPEYHFLPHAYSKVTRGLGAIPVAPVSSAAVENVMCFQNDTFRFEDILLREMAMGIVHLALKHVDPTFEDDLKSLYSQAILNGKWKESYAIHTPDSYLGEGVQSYFDANAYSAPPNGMANSINNRRKLIQYDHDLYSLVRRIFPCANNYMKRCNSRENEHFQKLRMDCDIPYWPWF